MKNNTIQSGKKLKVIRPTYIWYFFISPVALTAWVIGCSKILIKATITVHWQNSTISKVTCSVPSHKSRKESITTNKGAAIIKSIRKEYLELFRTRDRIYSIFFAAYDFIICGAVAI